MSLPDRFRSDEMAANTADRAEILARYKHLRAIGRQLNDKLVKRLGKDVLDEAGKKLGILQGGTLVFNFEDETSVLMDYCLYDVRRKGHNAVEQYLLDALPDPESDEMACLRAMQHPVYSVFLVESVLSGFGVTVRDLLSNKTIVIVDIGFGDTAEAGVLFASRLLFHEGFAMTTGAALPIGLPPEDQRESISKMLAKAAPNDGSYFDPAPLIRACLKEDCSSHVHYEEPTRRLVERQQRLGSVRSVGRNDPCPCGSGKKFKNCCLKRS